MVHRIKKLKNNQEAEWGFDLTDVSSTEDFLKLLKKYKFRKVESQKPSEKIVMEGKKMDLTWDKYMGKGRFKEYHVLWKNPDGIKIRVEHLGGKGNEEGFLGYIGIKAPRRTLPKLKSFLKEFRGNRPIDRRDWSGRRGIARYIKEESPHEGGFIGV